MNIQEFDDQNRLGKYDLDLIPELFTKPITSSGKIVFQHRINFTHIRVFGAYIGLWRIITYEKFGHLHRSYNYYI